MNRIRDTEKSVSKRRQWYHQEQDQSCFPCKRQREESRSEEKHVPVRLPATNAHPCEQCLHNEEWPRPTRKKTRKYSCARDEASEAGLDRIRNARPPSQRPHRNKGEVKARLHRRDVKRSSVTEDSVGSHPPSRQHRRGRARSASYARGRRGKYSAKG